MTAAQNPARVRSGRRAGMTMNWEQRDGQRVRVVDEDLLFATLRDRLDAWPSHQYRMRRLQAATAIEPIARTAPP